jgi:valyl-tRNA synthetase
MWEGKKVNGEGAIVNCEWAIQWFESRLSEARNEVDILMNQFRLSEALKTIYSLIWNDFCSWYLEWIKPEF